MYRGNQNEQPQPQGLNAAPVDQNRSSERRQGPIDAQMSILEQFKESWPIAIIGFVLLVAGMCLLFWNEGRAVKVAYSLDEALHKVVTLPNTMKILPEYEGHLVYFNGPISIAEPLTESDYQIFVASVKLKRRVQMYQWIEIEEERSYGGITEDEKHYYYTTEWKDEVINSEQFYIRTGHQNPKYMPIESQVQIADDVKIGVITLGTELKKKFSDFVEIVSDERPRRRDIKLHSGLYYHSVDLRDPQIGDIRVEFSYAGKGGDIHSIIGFMDHGIIVPYITSHGEEILLQRKNNISVDQMFHMEHVHNYWRTWAIRGLGWLVMFLSATCLRNILRTVILNSTFLYQIIAIESVTMSVSMSSSLLVIGFAWIWYRPFIGLCLTLASILPFIYSKLTSNSQPQQRYDYRRL